MTPDLDAPSPVGDDDAARWLALLRDTDLAADEADAAGHLPHLAALPTPEHYATLLERSAATRSSYDAVADATRHPAFGPLCALPSEQRGDLPQRMAELARQIVALERRREPWTGQALHDIRTGRASTWTARAGHIEGLLGHAWPALRHLGPATRVTIGAGADLTAIASLSQHLRDHLHGGGVVKLTPEGSVKLGVFTNKAVKNSRPLFDAVHVDGRPPTTVDQLTALMAHLEVDRDLTALDRAWPADVQIPAEDTLQERLQWHATELGVLKELLAVGHEIAQEQKRFEQLRLPQPDWSDLDSVRGFAHLVDAAARHDAYEAAATPLRELAESTAASAAPAGAAPVCAQLADAVRRGDRQAYDTAYRRARRLHAVRDLVAERNGLTERVAAAAPALAAAVTAAPHDKVWTAGIPSLGAAWNWSRAGAWILGQQTEDANALAQQLDVAEVEIRQLVERLAGLRAWRHAVAPARLTGQARADLNLYVRLVKRLGKGTGRYAPARRAEIRHAMDRCRPAVPVWIMPIYRIVEQLRVTENMFDVIIVDEASQAGLEATFLQYLAPRIVVIGDDKQVSPAAVGVDQQQLRDLANQYLADHRYKASWQDPKLSLFDAASIWYGNKRTLVEHRRCVPEIIGFSYRIAYEPENTALVPVRQVGADRLDPVKAVHVPAGQETGSSSKLNHPEVDAVAAQIEKCLADPRYDGKTFGVISLLGPRQAKAINDVLLERIRPEEWTVRQSRCGDATAFQGSERDVVFLTMVSAPQPGQRMGSRTEEESVQRYNVAASRAKDQLWVFHSITLDQLTSPEDMRFKLLDYCYNGVGALRAQDTGALGGLVPEDRRVEPFETVFQQRVHNRLVERGYTVEPQVEWMGYLIDLVVVGARGRLAVECDDDQWVGPEQYLDDLDRERDLRRCGWRFFRIKESAFYVDEDVALAELWDALDQWDIRPLGGGEVVSPEIDAEPEAAAVEEPLVEDISKVETAASGRREGSGLHAYTPFAGWAPPALQASRTSLEAVLADIVAAEGPVVGPRMQSAYVAASGGRRVSRTIAQALDRALTTLIRQGRVIADAPLGEKEVGLQTFRLPEQPAVIQRELGPRDLHQVPPLELAASLRDAAAVTGWDTADDVYREVLGRLGRVRLTTRAQQTLAALMPHAMRLDAAEATQIV